MDYHEILKIAGGLLALLLFLPLIAIILKDSAGQSCATWLLWGALDVILTLSILKEHGNFLLTLAYGIGDLTLVVVLLVKGRFSWSRFETGILALVLGCLIAWHLGGPRTAAIASTLAVCVAGIPGLAALWKNPQRDVGNVWAGYTLANGISFFGGNAMTLEERFTPGVFAVCSLVMFIASRRKKTSAERCG